MVFSEVGRTVPYMFAGKIGGKGRNCAKKEKLREGGVVSIV